MVTRINPPEHDSTSLAAGGWPIVGDVEADGCIGCPPNSRHAGHVGKIVFYRRKTALRQALDIARRVLPKARRSMYTTGRGRSWHELAIAAHVLDWRLRKPSP